MSEYMEISKTISGALSEVILSSKSKIKDEAWIIHGAIIKLFYSSYPGSDIGLARRTGAAAKSWKVAIKDGKSFSASVYSAGVPYADMSEEVTITPKSKKWLAIPVGPSLTKNGAPRYPDGPRQAARALIMPPVKQRMRKQNPGQRDPLKFFLKDSQTAFLFAKDGVRGTGLTKDKRLMFVLKKKVKRPARTRLLMPWVSAKLDKMFKEML